MIIDEIKDYPPYLDYPKPYNPLTNADRIRSMTDEELAKFLDRCETTGYEGSNIAIDSKCNLMDMLEWLQQPVEGV